MAGDVADFASVTVYFRLENVKCLALMGYPNGNAQEAFRLIRKEVKLVIEIWKQLVLDMNEITQREFENRAKSRAHIRKDLVIPQQDEVPEFG